MAEIRQEASCSKAQLPTSNGYDSTSLMRGFRRATSLARHCGPRLRQLKRCREERFPWGGRELRVKSGYSFPKERAIVNQGLWNLFIFEQGEPRRVESN